MICGECAVAVAGVVLFWLLIFLVTYPWGDDRDAW